MAPQLAENLFDPLTDAEFAALKADIAKRGQMTPIVVDEATNEVVDGNHRLRACNELGLEPWVVRRDYADQAAREEEAITLNMVRRQLGVAEWGRAFAKLLEVRGVKRGRGGRTKEEQGQITFADVAAEVGVPDRTARWRLRVAEELADDPDLAEQVNAGELPGREAIRSAALRKARRQQPAARALQPVASQPAPLAASRRAEVIAGDCLEVLADLPPASIDAIVTDPPSGVSAAGATWDGDRGGRDQFITWLRERAEAMLTAVKPGAHAVVWSLPRSSHWTAAAFEDAGWTLTDVITHHTAQGMPKSPDLDAAVSRLDPSQAGEWSGWRSGLAPGSEHWLLLRRSLEGTVAQNLLEHGVGAMNINASRVGDRWPRNVLFSHHEDCRQEGTREIASNSHWSDRQTVGYGRGEKVVAIDPAGEDRHRSHETVESWECVPGCPVGALGDNARFFFAAKPATAERDAGLGGAANDHPAVKPLALLRYLVTLVCPPGGQVLDPFAGSGSVGCAAMQLDGDFRYFGIEEVERYVEVARKRIGHWESKFLSEGSRPSRSSIASS